MDPYVYPGTSVLRNLRDIRDMAELNAIHPFREGNGRAQREFIRQLAARSGYSLNWSRVSGDQMARASKDSFQRGDNAGLEQALQTALDSAGNRAKD